MRNERQALIFIVPRVAFIVSLYLFHLVLIGLDGIPLSEPKTGVGHYTMELARALALYAASDEFEIVSPRPFLSTADDGESLPPNLRMVKAEVNVLGRRWWTIGLPRYIRQRSLALFHGTNYDVPLWKPCPTVLTIHDLSLLLYPKAHESRRVRRARYRLPLMTRAADRIITPTEAVRREVCARFGISPEKVCAIPEAPRRKFRRMSTAETREVRKRLGVEDEFLLFVGTIEPRKNLSTILRAFAEVLRRTRVRAQLVIVGRRGWLTDPLFVELKESGVRERVLLAGYLADEDLCALYSSCRVFIYPSFYEGFGLPPLEAMACGAPVIASRIPSLMEVAQEAALLVAPDDAGELAHSLIALLDDERERERLSTAGLKRATAFSWERTARLTLEAYSEAVKGKGQK